jgi:hypothetical protein
MKRIKRIKKTKKYRLFRKNVSKRYKKNRIGGAIDWAVPVPKSPGKTPKQPTPKSPTQSLKELLSRVDKGEPNPTLENRVVQSYKSKKSSGKKLSPLKISDFNEGSDTVSVSHVRKPYIPIETGLIDDTNEPLKMDEIITSYKLSSRDKDSQSSSSSTNLYEPGKNVYVESPPNEIQATEADGTITNIPAYGYVPAPQPTPPPRGLTIKLGSVRSLPSKEYETLVRINKYSQYYYYLSPKLHKIMYQIKITELFGTALVWGDLNDDLIEWIGESSEKAIESRLMYKNKQTIRKFIEKCKNFYTSLEGLNDNRMQNRPYNYDANSPFKQSPSNYQVVGYNQHMFFNPVPITQDLYEKGMRNNKEKTNEYVFVQAHGGMGTELSQHKKILAKKYIRLIEFGSRYQIVGAYVRTLFKEINDLMRRDDYPILFENTRNGEQMRKKVYSELCKYFAIGSFEACSEKDALTLVDITHDRVFEGHFDDLSTPENQKITFRSMEKFKTMGMFVPNDYNTDTTDKFLYNKEMFKLYPGSTFLTTSTKMKLVDTLLPIAINENKVFNVIVFSCAVRYQDEIPEVNPPPMPKIVGVPVAPPIPLANKGKIRDEMKLIHFCKLYISQLLRFITEFEIALIPVTSFYSIKDIYDPTPVSSTKNPYSISDKDAESAVLFLNNVGILYDIKYGFLNSFSFDMINSKFSFNKNDETDKPYYLIDSTLNPNINEKSNEELIMIKLYIIKEFFDHCFKKNLLNMLVSDILYSILFYISQATVNPIHKQSYDTNMIKLHFFVSYFKNLQFALEFCDKGLQKKGDSSFYNYPKFVEMVSEYKKKHMRKIYDNIFPNMDYDSYELEMKQMPIGWISQYDPNTSAMFYVNTITGKSYWNRPLIPPGWTEYLDSSTSMPYYINNQTNVRSDTLPGEGDEYHDSMYFNNTRKLKNPKYDEHKQRKYAYKYDEMENIENVRKRRDITRRKMAIKPHLLSAARNMTRSIHRREGEKYGLKAQEQTEQWKKNLFLMKQAEENIKPNLERYHVST